MPEEHNTAISHQSNRPILPKTSSESQFIKAGPSRSRSDAVKTACDRCRKAKVKCSGKQPSCQRCLKSGFDCHYDTSSTEVSRRLQTLMKLKMLGEENSSFKELLDHLKHRPQVEATEILTRLRQSDNPLSVLDEIRNAMFLIASPDEHLSIADREGRSIDARVWQRSYLTLPAHPWTAINRPGLISSLVSGFFEWDSQFTLNIIEEDLFVRDMRACNVKNAKYCSPMLVNAMCAYRCCQSSAVRQLLSSSGFDARKSFINEAKKLFDIERNKICLTSVQALLIMFLYHALVGQDRAGMMYRYMAFHMVKILRLEHRYKLLVSENDADLEEKRAIRRCLWGLFCTDCMIGYPYLQLPLLPSPSIEIPDEEALPTQRTMNVYPWLDNRKRISNTKLGQHFRNTMCEVCKLQYQAMAFNEHSIEETENGLTSRRQLYTSLTHLLANVSQHIDLKDNSIPEIVFLKGHISVAIYCILQFLPEDTIVSINGATVRDVFVERGIDDIEAVTAFMKDWSHEEYSCSAMYPVYNSGLVLVFLMHDRRCIPPLLQACKLLLRTSIRFSISLYLLMGIRALADKLGKTNAGVQSILLTISTPDLTEDVPADYDVPQYSQIRSALAISDGYSLGMKMQELITTWTAASCQ